MASLVIYKINFRTGFLRLLLRDILPLILDKTVLLPDLLVVDVEVLIPLLLLHDVIHICSYVQLVNLEDVQHLGDLPIHLLLQSVIHLIQIHVLKE